MRIPRVPPLFPYTTLFRSLPMTMGFGVGLAFDSDSNTALFLGAALAATSVGITARVFSDLRALTSIEARTVLGAARSEEHTSELQSRFDLVCRLLLEKKNT